MTLFCGRFGHGFGDDMSKNSNGAKEQAKRNRMPSFNLILQSILENMPEFKTTITIRKITKEWENKTKIKCMTLQQKDQ